ncbi:MAG: hypothetical protein HC945_02425 [Nitrosarchaeum sp.]|nr:hypothetical protein [Nitrosarchaeum sp.]
MPTVQQRVWDALDKNVSWQEGLSEGIINLSALATRLSEALHIPGSTHAIISAIRRYPVPKERRKQLSTILRKARISTASSICTVRWNAGPPTDDLQHMFDAGVLGSQVQMRLLKGEGTYSAILPETHAQRLSKRIPSGRILELVCGLAEIHIHLTPERYHTPGLMNLILSTLSAQGINVDTILATPPHISLYIKESDLPKAHASILLLDV